VIRTFSDKVSAMASIPVLPVYPTAGEFWGVSRAGEFDEVLVCEYLDTPDRELICYTTTADGGSCRWAIVQGGPLIGLVKMSDCSAARVSLVALGGATLNEMCAVPHAVRRWAPNMQELIALHDTAVGLMNHIMATCRLDQVFQPGSNAADLPTFQVAGAVIPAPGALALAFAPGPA
jgi:hypothetical protein